MFKLFSLLSIIALTGVATTGINNSDHVYGLASDQYTPGVPYIEIGTSNYTNGSTTATFNKGIVANAAEDIYYYIYISNKNFYNSTSANTPYTSLNETLIFINVVFYISGGSVAQGFTFPILNRFGSVCELNNWKNLQNFTFMISQYQTTNYFVIDYNYQYTDYVTLNVETHENTTPITNPRSPHYFFTESIGTRMTLTEYFGQSFTYQFYGYPYNFGFNEGYNSGLDAGYDIGYSQGVEDGLTNDSAYQEGYSVGFGDGVETNSGYIIGYNDGSNESFLANIGDWIVPAIIIVLVGGGFLSIMAIKKRES